MKKPRVIKDRWIILLILIVCIPVAIPLLRSDFFHFSDEPHIANLYQMIRAFQSGQFPPRWAPDMSFGYGYPFFNFYYPLPFYLGSLFFVFTHSLIWSLKLVFLITIPLSGIFMFAWLRQHTGRLASLVGSIIYVYTPYRAVDLYVRGAIGEALAFVFFPLIALFVHRIFNKHKLQDIGLLGLTVGGFILSHNLAPIFFLPWIAGYSLVLCWKQKRFSGAIKIGIGILLGLGISLYFWLPGLIEKAWLVSKTPFYYLDHFPFIKQLILPSWGYGSSVWGPTDEISFQIGIVNIVLIIIGVLIFLKTRKRLLLTFFLGSLGAFLFLMNIRSTFLWELTPLSNYIQFPWRLLMLTTFLTSSLVVFVKSKTRSGKLLLMFLGAASVILTVSYFRPSEYFKTTDDYFLNRFFANRTIAGVRENISEEYFNYSEDYLLLPLWVKERPSNMPKRKFVSEELEIVSVEEINAVYYKTKVDATKEGVLTINNYYYPGWEVYVDKKKVPIEILEPNGNMSVNVSSGSHEVELKWKETPIRNFSNKVSFVGFTTAMTLLFVKKKKR